MRKAYIFIMDVVFASMILLIGFMIISSTRPRENEDIPLPIASDSILDSISRIRIRDVCNTDCNCSISVMESYCVSGIFLNKDATIAESLGEMKRTGKSDAVISLMFVNVTKKLVRQDIFGKNLIIDGHTVYSDPGKDSSPEIISGKRMVFGYYEDITTGDVTFWGPYILEVDVWK